MIKDLVSLKSTLPESGLLMMQKRHYTINHCLSSQNQILPDLKKSGKRMDVPKPVSNTVQYAPHVKVRIQLKKLHFMPLLTITGCANPDKG